MRAEALLSRGIDLGLQLLDIDRSNRVQPPRHEYRGGVDVLDAAKLSDCGNRHDSLIEENKRADCDVRFPDTAYLGRP